MTRCGTTLTVENRFPYLHVMLKQYGGGGYGFSMHALSPDEGGRAMLDRVLTAYIATLERRVRAAVELTALGKRGETTHPRRRMTVGWRRTGEDAYQIGALRSRMTAEALIEHVVWAEFAHMSPEPR